MVRTVDRRNTCKWLANANDHAIGSVAGAYDVGSDTNPTVSMTVTSKSWTSAGVETTAQRTVYGKSVLRKPYPNQTSKDETVSGSDIILKVVLSDYIYQGDTVSNVSVVAGFHTDSGAGGSTLQNVELGAASITNSSVETYPAPIAMWLNHDRDWVKSNSYTVQMAVAHKAFRSGLPVRAVKFIATDEHTNTVSTTVSTMTKRDFSVTGLSAPVFSGALDFSSLTQGDLVTIDAIIYPWVGDAFQVSVGGDTYPSPNLTIFKVLNDRTGAYGTAYAYVDAVGGGTPQVSTNAATAAANPYSTIALAAAAIQTFNNSTFSRNNVSGGIIRLTATSHTQSSYSARAVGDIPLIVEAADIANKTTTIYQNIVASHDINGIPDLLKIKDVTLRQTSSKIFLDNAGTKDGNFALILENCHVDANSLTAYSGWVYQVGRAWMIDCSGDNLSIPLYSSTICRPVIAIGCSECAIGGTTYQAIGCKSLRSWPSTIGINSASYKPPVHNMFGWNFISTPTNGVNVFTLAAIANSNFASVGNIIEQCGGNTAPVVTLSADGVVLSANNILDIGNTIVGSRTNILYQDTGTTTVQKNGVSSLSIHYKWNCKSDVFSQSGNCVGNWAFLHRVGSKLNATRNGGSNGPVPGVGFWIGEVAAYGDTHGSDATPLVCDFITDASYTGTGAGNGDYTPGAATELPQIPSGETAYPYDLLGRAIPTDGTAYVGAVQQAA